MDLFTKLMLEICFYEYDSFIDKIKRFFRIKPKKSLSEGGFCKRDDSDVIEADYEIITPKESDHAQLT